MSLEQTDGYRDGNQFADEVINSLKEVGINLDEELALSFFLFLPDKNTALQASKQIEKEGFQVGTNESADEENNDWLCWCNKTFIPSEKDLQETGDLFLSLATEFNGEFDGWETNPYENTSTFLDFLSEFTDSNKK